MRWTSVRVRLTLWNVAVLALVLAGFGIGLCYTVSARLSAAVDRDLTERARMFRAGWDRPGFPGGPFLPFAGGPGQPRGPGPFGPGTDGAGLPDVAWSPGPAGPPGQPGMRPGPVDPRDVLGRPRVLPEHEGSEAAEFPDAAWDEGGRRGAAAGQVGYSTVTRAGIPFRIYSAPLRRDGAIVAVVQIAHPMAEQQRLMDGLVGTLLTLIPLALLVAGSGGLFLADRALRPLRRLTQTAAQISARDLSRRLEVHGNDELSDLALTFNGMVSRLEDAFRRLEAAYEQQRRFTGDASHELRTPLTVIKANTSLALFGDRTGEEYREALRAADQAADTMGRIVQDLLLLARADAGRLRLELRPVPLDRVLRQALAALPGRGAPVSLEIPTPPALVFGDPHHLTRLFTNLLENAGRHTPPDGTITVTVDPVPDSSWPGDADGGLPEGGLVEVRVQDTGEGIPPDHLPHVCERFYRIDASRTRSAAAGARTGGTGLGLAICASIIQAHGGTLTVASELGKGTTVTVRIPGAGLSD